MSAQKSLDELESGLLEQSKSPDGLGKDGARLLELLQSGPVLEGGPSAFAAGLTFNFSDEVIGFVQDVLGSNDELTGLINKFRASEDQPPLSAGDVSTELERRSLRQYRKTDPVKAFGYEMGGAMLPAALIPGGGQANLGRVALTGLASGALSGTGAADDGNRLQGAVVGGGTGFVASPLTTLAGRGAGKAYRGIFKPGAAQQGVNQADQMARSAIEADAGSLRQAGRALQASRAAGKPMSLVDMGPNSRGLTDAARIVGNVGSNARKTVGDFLQRRDLDAVKRISGDLQKAFGKRARFFPEFKSMTERRSRLGGKLYQRANKKMLPVNSEVISLFQRGSVRSALRKGYEIAREEGINLPPIRVIERDGVFRLVTQKGKPVKEIQTQLMHYIKMGLDDKVFTGRSPTSGIGSTELGAIKATRAKLLDFMDARNPGYKMARNYWAGATSALDAMKNGRNFLRADPDELADDIGRMSKSEKEAFRVGAMQNLMDRVEGDIETANIARNLIKRQRNKDLIRLTFEPGNRGAAQFNKFMRNLTREIDMKTSSSTVMGNSQTAARTEAIAALREGAARQIPTARGIPDIVIGLLRRNAQDLTDEQLRNAANRLAQVFTTTDPAGVSRILRQLETPTGVKQVLQTIGADVPTGIASRAINPMGVGNLLGSRAQGLLSNIMQ